MYYKESWLDKLDRKFGRHAIPNLMTILTVCTVAAWALDYIMYFQTGMSFSSFLVFNRDLIFQGQVWRVLTFLFIPPQGNVILSALMLYFYWMIGSALEREWGDFRFNLYYLFGFVGAILSGLITGYATSEYINLSLFLAFAILNPNYPVRLFFLIPIPVKFLAIVDGLFLVWRLIMESWPGRVAIAFSLLNLLLFFGGNLFRRIKNLRRQKEYRDSFTNRSDDWDNDPWRR